MEPDRGFEREPEIANNEEIVNTVNNVNNNMNEETSTNQVPIQDQRVNEYLNGINTFLKNMEKLQVGGGNSIVSSERTKIAKLFNVMSVETLLSNLNKDGFSTQNNNNSSSPSSQQE